MDVPSEFGPYRIVAALGRGGMAETFVADRVGADGSTIRVCLKRILPGLVSDPELARAFETEARIAATLRHANVACLVDHGVVDDRHYLALELVEGVDLRALLRHARRSGANLDAAILAEIAFAVVHALEYAHALGRDGESRGLVHRDLSPSNVLLGTRGEVKLADFGIAKVMGTSHHTKTGLLKGKIPYMPPEYIGGGGYGPKGDLFALGVTLFECLAGVRPFDGASDAETLDRIVRGDGRAIRRLRPDLDPGFEALLGRLLATDPSARADGAREILDLLAPLAPPASTRAALAAHVVALAPEEPRVEDLAYDPTELVENDAAAPLRVARPDDPTKTRLPR